MHIFAEFCMLVYVITFYFSIILFHPESFNTTYFAIVHVLQALRSFSIAVHLNPTDKELWTEDLKWATELLLKKETDKNDANGVLLTDGSAHCRNEDNVVDEQRDITEHNSHTELVINDGDTIDTVICTDTAVNMTLDKPTSQDDNS